MDARKVSVEWLFSVGLSILTCSVGKQLANHMSLDAGYTRELGSAWPIKGAL